MSSRDFSSCAGRLSVGAVPPPDRARVAALALELRDGESGSFGDVARAGLLTAVDGLAAAASDIDAAPDEDLDRVAGRIDALTADQLKPPRGLAALFSGRAKRLRRFRAAFEAAAQDVSDGVAALAAHADAPARRIAAIGAGHVAVQDAVLEADAHVAAGLAALHAPGPLKGDADLMTRLARLIAVRTAAVRALPLARRVQNAEGRLGAPLTEVPAALTGWRQEWRDALGLDALRPQLIRPDATRLTGSREQVLTVLGKARTVLEVAQADRNSARTRLRAAADRIVRLGEPPEI